MRQIKYFSESWNTIEASMNKWIRDNQKSINIIYNIHISKEWVIESSICVNGYIDYEPIGGK